MLESYYSPGVLAYLAGGFYVLGLITIHQVVLRLFLLTGTGVYILYYATAADTPLMDAIYVSLMIGSANLFGLASLFVRRSRLAVPRAFADVYDVFPPLPPGDFRILMTLARRYTTEREQVLTVEGQPGEKLYFVISGTTRLRKRDIAFSLPPHLFLGEISFLTGQTCSATSWIPAGAEILEWDFEALNRRCTRSARFKLALDAAISVDLAGKVARAVGPDYVHYPIATLPEPRRDAG